jgi:hypothetical protein
MGNTCASFHVHWLGAAADAGRAITRAYGKLGWDKAKKPPAEGGKTVIVLARAGEPFVSVYDSTQADLDSGELKDAALTASKLLKTGAVFTTVYDSDTYEFAIFGKGKQIDLLMSDIESYAGPMKSLDPKTRARQWGALFGRRLIADEIEQAAAEKSAFAEAALSRLAGLVGLPADRPLIHYRDLAEQPEAGASVIHFARNPVAVPAAGPGEIRVRNYYDRHNSRKLLVYPAAWPMPLDTEEILTWLFLSEGDGFTGGSMDVEVSGSDGLTISRGFMNGANFHNGQIVGGYELPKDATAEVGQAYLETKRFRLEPQVSDDPNRRFYVAEYPNMTAPPMTPTRSTQIIVVLQFHLTAEKPGEWTVQVNLRLGAGRAFLHRLPAARIAAVRRSWLPIVTGLNPGTIYDTSERLDESPSEPVMDLIVGRSMNSRVAGLSAAEARAAFEKQIVANRERGYKVWLQDFSYHRDKLTRQWGLEHPAIAANVAIVADRGQSTLDASRPYLEKWLHGLTAKSGQVRVHAERRMTAGFTVGKVKKAWPAATLLSDKAWGKFFAETEDYQSVRVDYWPDGAEFPVAGMGLALALRDWSEAPAERGFGRPSSAYVANMLALTLTKMRGREFPVPAMEGAAHVYDWAINRPETFAMLDGSVEDMTARLDSFAVGNHALQAWHCATAWIPRFDLASDYEATDYEDMSALSFFRGVLIDESFGLTDQRMTEAWCANVLRFVAPRMWLGSGLFGQLDRAAVECVARVFSLGETFRLEKRSDCSMEEFELALLPILPLESRRVTVGAGA